MIHVYFGEGKGKTTAAMGLALRYAGRGRPVLVAQFCKSDSSGERMALAQIPQVRLLTVPSRVCFTFQMSPSEKEQERIRYQAMLKEIQTALETEPVGLLVLDEVCAALRADLVPLEQICSILDLCTEHGTEAVLTGRDPDPELLKRADYATRMEKVRHPYDRGIRAREGAEY